MSVSLLTGLGKGLNHELSVLLEVRLDELLELFTGELSVEVLLIEQVVHVDVGLGVSTEQLAGLLGGLEKTQTASGHGEGIVSVLLGELGADDVHDGKVKDTTSEVPVGVVADDTCLTLLEAGDCDGSLGVTHVHEGHDSLLRLLVGEVSLSEEAVIVNDGGGLVDDAEAVDAGDLSSVKKALTLRVGRVGWHRDDEVFALDAGLLVEGVDLHEVEGNDLLDGELLLSSHVVDVKHDFVVLEEDSLVGHELLLEGKLLLAGSVESHEADWEEDGVLEVLLGLDLDGVANDSLRGGLEGDLDTTSEEGD
jgi:hypothetical protein